MRQTRRSGCITAVQGAVDIIRGRRSTPVGTRLARPTAVERCQNVIVIPFPTADRIMSILSDASAQRRQRVPHCNLTPAAYGVDESGGRAGVWSPNPGPAIGP